MCGFGFDNIETDWGAPQDNLIYFYYYTTALHSLIAALNRLVSVIKCILIKNYEIVYRPNLY